MQFNFPTIDPLVTTGSELADYLNGWVPAVESSHLGASRPSYIGAGGVWVEAVSASVWNVRLYTGTADAIIAQINPATGGVVASPPFAVGTRMLFQQTTPPAGWTKDADAALNDVGLRVTTGSVTNGGATAFSSVFGTGKNTGGYTLTTADIPSHLHAVSITSGNNSVDHTHTGTTGVNSADHTHTVTVNSGGAHSHSIPTKDSSSAGVGFIHEGASGTATTLNTGSFAAHTHTTTVGNNSVDHTHTITTGVNSVDHTHSVSGNTGNTGGGASHLHSLSLDLKFTSVIVAVKD